jgi:hypothetical protein
MAEDKMESLGQKVLEHLLEVLFRGICAVRESVRIIGARAAGDDEWLLYFGAGPFR